MKRQTLFVFLLLSIFSIFLTIPLFSANLNSEKISIAVMDFQNTSEDEKLDYLQRAIPEALITQLAKSGQLNIVERGRLQDALRELNLSQSGVVDQDKAVQIGKAVGANAIIVGSYLEIGGLIRINARLIDVQTSRVLKAESVQGRTGTEIFNLMDRLAEGIKSELAEEAPPEKPEETLAKEPEKIVQKDETKHQPEQQQQIPQVQPKKGGSNAALYIIGGAVLVGGGVAAAVLLSQKKDNSDGGSNGATTIEIIIPLSK